MVLRDHQTSFPLLQQLPMRRWISTPARGGRSVKDLTMCVLPFPHATKLPYTCGKQNPPTSARKTQPKPPQKLQPPASAAWAVNGPLEVSRERQHLGPQERRLVSSPLQRAAKEISCSPSSLLAPFLHKANLVKSSTGPQAALTSAADPEVHLTQQTLNNSFSNGSRRKRLQILSVLPKKYLFAAAKEKV